MFGLWREGCVLIDLVAKGSYPLSLRTPLAVTQVAAPADDNDCHISWVRPYSAPRISIRLTPLLILDLIKFDVNVKIATTPLDVTWSDVGMQLTSAQPQRPRSLRFVLSYLRLFELDSQMMSLFPGGEGVVSYRIRVLSFRKITEWLNIMILCKVSLKVISIHCLSEEWWIYLVLCLRS